MTYLFSFSLSETESLVFRTEQDKFLLFSKHESSQETQIATYIGGKWYFDNFQQRKLFFFLYNIYKIEFGKALKSYIKSIQEKFTKRVTDKKKRAEKKKVIKKEEPVAKEETKKKVVVKKKTDETTIDKKVVVKKRRWLAINRLCPAIFI
jgi:hypothetical protein